MITVIGFYTGVTWPTDFVAAGVPVPTLDAFLQGEQRTLERSRGVLTLDDERRASLARQRRAS